MVLKSYMETVFGDEYTKEFMEKYNSKNDYCRRSDRGRTRRTRRHARRRYLSAPADNMGQMMQDDSEKGHGMGMNNKDMPMMKMMTRMNDMMETCNKMMQSKMENMNGPDGSTDKG